METVAMSDKSRFRKHSASRRQWLLSATSLAAAIAGARIVSGSTSSAIAFSADPFQMGVASGDPSEDGVVLWTRISTNPTEIDALPSITYPVRWELSEDDSFRSIVRNGTEYATPQLGHSVHVELSGLQPDRWYWYRFHCGDATSPVGRTRTMPASETLPNRLRFAFASCQHFENGLYTAYEHMAKEELDLVLHLGDYIYEKEGMDGRVRKHLGQEITTLNDYRRRYAQYRSDIHLQKMHSLCPWAVVWDDHELDNNYAGAISEELGVSPEELLRRRANSYQAYYENMPLRRSCLPKGADLTLHRTIRFGRLAQFEMLDTRQYRTDQPNGDRQKPLEGAVFDPKATMLGDAQEKWLMSELLQSTSNWNVLAQQIMMGRVDRVPGQEAGYSMDQWSGYDVARKRLLTFLQERQIPNPVVLTGDIHSNWVNDLKVNFDAADDPVVATEFVGTSISSGGNGQQTSKDQAAILSENPFVRFQNSERGYVSCEVTPGEWRSRYQVVEYVDRPGAPLVTRAEFVVEDGKAGATPG
jgi:alkaline phosphatase D